MNRGRCILVFGVSGVGKSSACSDFATRHPDYLHFSAGNLLREAKAASTERLRTAKATEIEENQNLIGEELRRRREGQWERPVIVDAHGVIDNDVELVPIPIAAIESLEPSGLILLHAPPDVIAWRRHNDARTRPARSLEEIRHELDHERQAVCGFAAALVLPLVVEDAIDGYELDSAVDQLARLESSE